MKLRTDFVTNSSSSSFVIATKTEIPLDMQEYFKKVDKETLAIELNAEFNYSWLDNEEQLRDLGNFTEEQMELIKMIACGNCLADTYIECLDEIEEGNTIYIGTVPDYRTSDTMFKAVKILRRDEN